MAKKSSKEMVESAKAQLLESVDAAILEKKEELEIVQETTDTPVVVEGSEPVVETAEKDAEDKKDGDEKDTDDKKKFTESADGGDADKDSDTMEEKVVLVTPVVEVSEDINAILGNDENLSEGFKEKISLVFEAALNAKISEITKTLQESANAQLEVKIAEIKESTEKSAQAFIDMVAEEWITENSLAVEQGLRVEIAEGLVQDMKSLMEMYHISLPAEKVDLLEEKSKEVDSLKADIASLTEAVASKTKEVLDLQKQEAFNVLSEGLAETQKEKFSTLVADVVAEDVESFKEKASIIKESYFSKGAKDTKEVKVVTENKSSVMSGYISKAKELNKSW